VGALDSSRLRDGLARQRRVVHFERSRIKFCLNLEGPLHLQLNSFLYKSRNKTEWNRLFDEDDTL
jgi:hypothetical protein